MKTVKLSVLSLMAAFAVCGSSAFAAENSSSQLRAGAVICPVNPETGEQEIYLPAIYTTVIEALVLQEGYTYLKFAPLKIGDDGQILEKAKFQERVYPAVPLYYPRQIIAAPALLAIRDGSNILWAAHDRSEFHNEARMLKLIAEARAKEPSPEDIQAAKRKSKEGKIKRRSYTHHLRDSNLRALIPETMALSDIQIGPNDIFHVVKIPARLEKKLYEKVINSPLELTLPQAKCAGYKIELSDSANIVPPMETEIVTQMAYQSSVKFLFFNIYGQRLKSSALIKDGYKTGDTTLNLAKKSDDIELIEP